MMYLKNFDAYVPPHISQMFIGISHLDPDETLTYVLESIIREPILSNQDNVILQCERCLAMMRAIGYLDTSEAGYGSLKYLDDLTGADLLQAQSYLAHNYEIFCHLTSPNYALPPGTTPEGLETTICEIQAAITGVVGYIRYQILMNREASE